MTFSGPGAERLADSIEAAACRDFYAAAPAALGLRVEHVAGATMLIAPTLPVTYFNRTIGLGNEAEATAGDIAAIRAGYARASVTTYCVHAIPSAQPTTLGTLLRDSGFDVGARGTWAKCLRAVDDPPAVRTSLAVREARAADVDAVAVVVASAFGMPAEVGLWFARLIGRSGWRIWVAEAQGQLVATGALFVAGDLGWLGVGATLADYRGRGAQSALLATRIRAAAQLGCRVVGTETGEPVGSEPNPSLANIRRAGFVKACSRLSYVPG